MIGQRLFENSRPSSFFELLEAFIFIFLFSLFAFFITAKVCQAILRQVKSQIQNMRSRNMKWTSGIHL